MDDEKHAKLNNEQKMDDKDVPDKDPQSANPTAGAEGAEAAVEPLEVDDAELVEATKQEPAKPSPEAFGWRLSLHPLSTLLRIVGRGSDHRKAVGNSRLPNRGHYYIK
ncbi:GH13917 [Drosophila grimshawi]|uniref:GH13917 n=1 Tax=Drosophila grimshawi TaxID=7222 RepID=B4K0V5_DROGR|nr:GH13917 [Drosophila grimshawi]